MDRGEDVGACMVREIQEEAGIVVEEMSLRGTISWPGFGKNGEDWFGFIFQVTRWSGAPLKSNPEGELEWVPVEDLLAGNIPLWDGDKNFLPYVFDKEPKVFHGTMPYANGAMVSWTYTRL